MENDPSLEFSICFVVFFFKASLSNKEHQKIYHDGDEKVCPLHSSDCPVYNLFQNIWRTII